MGKRKMKLLLVNANPLEKGCSERICKSLCEYIEEKATCEIDVFNQFNVIPEYGKCSVRQFIKAEKEDETEFERKLMNADGVVIVSPVYLHQVPGEFKITLDRFSYRMHEFPLIGKRVIIAVYCDNNGAEELSAFLKKLFISAGAEIDASELYLQSTGEESAFVDRIKKDIDHIYDCFEKKIFQITREQERLFQYYKSIVENEIKNGMVTSKHKRWNELIAYDSLCDYLRDYLLETV